MDRVNNIIHNEEYMRMLCALQEKEKTRIYCKHGLDHLLDVARIMYIEALERGLDIRRDVIYATALLHDIGRVISNEEHDIESARISIHILRLAGYDDQEIEMIREAILVHRDGGDSLLGDLLYRADKSSRQCYICESIDTCKWKVKNKEIKR